MEARLENPRSLAEAEPISDSFPSVQRKSWSLKMAVQDAVAFLSQQKEDPGAACSRFSQVSRLVSSARPVELFRYRYTVGDGLPTP
jgi:hypothetical protein